MESGSTVGDWNSGKVYTGAFALDYWAIWNWIGCVLWELGFSGTLEAIVLQFHGRIISLGYVFLIENKGLK